MNEREELFCEKLMARGWSTPDKTNELQNENARLRLLIDEAITSMSHAEVFITSREKMHSVGVKKWGELLDRMREAIDPDEEIGNASALLVGGE